MGNTIFSPGLTLFTPVLPGGFTLTLPSPVKGEEKRKERDYVGTTDRRRTEYEIIKAPIDNSTDVLDCKEGNVI
jgi:hypothetical protein